jgi:hypothetical protein
MRLALALSVVVMCSPVSTEGQRGALATPTGTIKDAISVIQQDGTKVAVQAQKGAVRPELGAFRAKCRMAVPSQGLPVVGAPASIEVPFTSRDLPGGMLILVKLESDKNGLAFRGDNGCQPEKGYIVVKTTDLKSVEKDGGVSYTLGQSPTLKSGHYAVVMLDNQYIWPFEIR